MGQRTTAEELSKLQRAWIKRYLAERGETLSKYEVTYSSRSERFVVAKVNGNATVRTTNYHPYESVRHCVYVGAKAGPGENWVYPSWVKMPKPKPLIEVGTTVLCTGRVRHNGCRCEVLTARRKIAGSQPREWHKYRLRCVDERCDWPRKEFSQEVGGPRRVRLLGLPVTIEMINTQRNTETRRAMIEIYGQGKYLIDAGAHLLRQDDWGKLWFLSQRFDEPLVMVEMVNSTPEPDGSYSHYFERVPPWMRTPLEALAWQAELTPAQYAKMTVQT